MSRQVLQASAGVGSNDRFASTEATNSVMGGDEQNVGYQTFLGHLYDLLEEKISSERYDEGVRQLVGNQVCRRARSGCLTILISPSYDGFGLTGIADSEGGVRLHGHGNDQRTGSCLAKRGRIQQSFAAMKICFASKLFFACLRDIIGSGERQHNRYGGCRAVAILVS